MAYPISYIMKKPGMIADHGEVITVEQEACCCGNTRKAKGQPSYDGSHRWQILYISLTLHASLNSADCKTCQ
jgi:hypothetical protein